MADKSKISKGYKELKTSELSAVSQSFKNDYDVTSLAASQKQKDSASRLAEVEIDLWKEDGDYTVN